METSADSLLYGAFWHISAHYWGFLSHSLAAWHRTGGYFQPYMKQCEDMPFNVLIAHTIDVLNDLLTMNLTLYPTVTLKTRLNFNM